MDVALLCASILPGQRLTFAGKEIRPATQPSIKSLLLCRVRVDLGDSPDRFVVSGRGELHFGID